MQIVSDIANSKYPEFVLGTSYPQIIPEYSQETGIYLMPIEQPGNNPYKLQEDSNDQPGFLQKYPTFMDEQNWLLDGANLIPPSLSFNKEKGLEKEDDFLAQLLDVGGFLEELGNDIYTPSNDTLIPVQASTPSEQTIPQQVVQQDTYHLSPEASPMHSLTVSSPQYPITTYNHYDIPLSFNRGFEGSPEGLKGKEYDPFVSGTNESFSPNNEIVFPSNEVIQPTDDLRDLLGELFGEDDLSLTNSFGQSYAPEANIIPSSNGSPTSIDDDTNHDPMQVVEEMTIPSFDLPPASKKPRESNSSFESMDETYDPPKTINITPDKPKRKPRVSNSLSSSSSPPSPLESPVSTKGSTKSQSSSGGGAILFGQHEDEIIQKLLVHHPGVAKRPITRDKLVIMPVEEFNTLLDEANLTEIEVAFMKEWRRRGKNKMAAQIARKRKRDELSELEDDMEGLRQKRAQLQQSVENLKGHIASFKRRAEAAEQRIYKHYSTVHGSLVSHETHTIHVTDDGKTMLIPRISSQILLV